MGSCGMQQGFCRRAAVGCSWCFCRRCSGHAHQPASQPTLTRCQAAAKQQPEPTACCRQEVVEGGRALLLLGQVEAPHDPAGGMAADPELRTRWVAGGGGRHSRDSLSVQGSTPGLAEDSRTTDQHVCVCGATHQQVHTAITLFQGLGSSSAFDTFCQTFPDFQVYWDFEDFSEGSQIGSFM